nr:N-acetylmuramyl-L-alanine amidase, muropeptide amidohydrolase, MA {N-terminal} {EC 3.5.1.28} [human, serum, Peptide Partial, 15 aa] [Homo sapiens]
SLPLLMDSVIQALAE